MYVPSFRRIGLLAVFIALTLSVCAQPPANAEVVDIAEQARAGRDKFAAEVAAVDGELLRSKLLQSAGNGRLSRWYAGEVLVDQKWLTLEQAQQQAAEDKHLTAYRKLRAESTQSLSGHERLARWCEKKDLAELANMHWLHVLQFEPNHQAALSELQLRWHHGLLLTEDEVGYAKEREKEWQQQKKIWQAEVKRLRRDIEKGEAEGKAAALKELRAIREPAAVPALLEVFAEPAKDEIMTLTRQTELIAVLGGISSPEAVEKLAQFAVNSDNAALRYAAIDQLKTKPLESYAPTLLAGMAMPVEACVSYNNRGNTVVSSYSYSQEKPGGEEYTEDRYRFQTVRTPKYRHVPLSRRGKYIPKKTIKGKTYKVPITPGHGRGWENRIFRCSNGTPFLAKTQVYGEKYLKEVKTKDRKVGGHYSRQFAGYGYTKDPANAGKMRSARGKLQRQALQAEFALEEHNRATRLQNERITGVLAEVTGETLSVFPKSWWNWWSDYLAQHPDVATVGTRRQLNSALLNQQQRGLARGTWVWTRRGKLPIESVKLGDYVLAQNPRSGELAYRVVLAVAEPQEISVSKVDFDTAELFCAPAHVVWSTGRGWQRVSKLSAEMSLHGAITEVRIAQVDKAFKIESYDLIVDGFHTFFVGEQGLLVHDATPIGPTHVALPGFSPAAVAEAADLAGLAR